MEKFLKQFGTDVILIHYCAICERTYKEDEKFCLDCFNGPNKRVVWKFKGEEADQHKKTPKSYFMYFGVKKSLKKKLQGNININIRFNLIFSSWYAKQIKVQKKSKNSSRINIRYSRW
jgi:hypothetical protein